MALGLLVFVAIVVAVVWFAAAYNQLVAAQQRVTQAWANIDLLLRQRHDELPRLVELCERHARFDHERLLEARAAIFGARHAQDPDALGRAENDLRAELAKLFALTPANAELAADQMFAALRQRIAALDADIAARREIYNAAVEENNAAIRRFPGRIVAVIGGFRASSPLRFETTAAD
jgi:LemA protein